MSNSSATTRSSEQGNTLDLQQLLSALASGARAVQGLPSSQDDYDYETSFPEFSVPLQSTRSTWLELVQSILQYSGLIKEKDRDNDDDILQYDNLEDPLLWDECADACEMLLEHITELDNNDIDSSSAASTIQKFGNAARINAVSQWSRMHDLLVTDLPKPQDIHSHLVPPVPGNDPTLPFVPRVHPDKPFGITSLPLVDADSTTTEKVSEKQKSMKEDIQLQIKLNPGHGLETRRGPLCVTMNPLAIPHDIVAPKEHCPHLYEIEIQSLEYTDEQLEVNPKETIKDPIPVVSPLQAVWVDTVESLEELAQIISDERTSEIAVDLEAHSYRSFAGVVCLMQITLRKGDKLNFDYTNYLVDTLQIDRFEINRFLAPIFANPRIVKVLHGADHDITWLQRDFGIYIVNLFDTGRAARALSFSSAGYAYLLKRYCSNEILIDKSHQLADWRQRPLTAAMQQYAIQDTQYLLAIYDALKVELYEKGGVDMIRQVLDTSKQVSLIRYAPEPYKPSGYKILIHNKHRRGGRYKNTERRTELNYRQEYVCREIWNWRDQMARKYDESVQYVLTNQALLRLSLACPTAVAQLQSLFHPMPSLLLRHSQDVVNLIKQAMNRAIEDEEQKEENDDEVEGALDDDDEDGEEEELQVNDNKIFGMDRKSSGSKIFSNTEEEDDEPTAQQNVKAAPSSAFFKPASVADPERTRRRGMMSPVLGTEALYMQAGWMTPQEQRQHRGDTAWESYHVESAATESTSVGGTDEDDPNDTNKPKRLLSVHPSNKNYNSKLYMDHSLEVGKPKESSIAPAESGRTVSLDGMGTVRAASAGSATEVLDDDAIREFTVQTASRIQSGLKDSIPVVLALLSNTNECSSENQRVSTVLDEDDGIGMFSKDGREKVNEIKDDEDENEALQSEEFFVIPKSIREIYQISNRNRRNKKAGSPTPERGVTPTNEKEREELMKAEALLKERGLMDQNGNSYLFEDNILGSSSSKRPRAKFGRESEESVPEILLNVASKEDDLSFMKEIGWIQNDEEVDGILSSRYGKSRTGETEASSTKIHAGDADRTDHAVKDVNHLGAARDVASPAFEHPPRIATSPMVGLIPSGQPMLSSNPFFSGAAMVGGPLTQQGLSKPDPQRSRKSADSKGKSNKGRQQERPEKRGDRTYSYRKK